MKRAPFIVIEGLDRSGKSTQTSLLEARLEAQGIPSKFLKFPDRTTPIGKMIDSYLKSTSDLDDHVIHLLFSANRWELASSIESLLNKGTTVICDRYAFSGIAFSESKVQTSDGTTTTPKLPFDWCRAPDIGLPAPDIVLFLDIAPEHAKLRGGFGEERYEQEEIQARVRQVFKRIGQEFQSLAGSGSESSTRWTVIDAGRDLDAVREDLWAQVESLVKDGFESPVGKLWER